MKFDIKIISNIFEFIILVQGVKDKVSFGEWKTYYRQGVFRTSLSILFSGGKKKKPHKNKDASNCCITFLISVLHGRLKAFHRCLLELIRLFGTPSCSLKGN